MTVMLTRQSFSEGPAHSGWQSDDTEANPAGSAGLSTHPSRSASWPVRAGSCGCCLAQGLPDDAPRWWLHPAPRQPRGAPTSPTAPLVSHFTLAPWGVLDFHLPDGCDAEPFMGLLATCVSSLKKHLFGSFVQVLIGLCFYRGLARAFINI